MARSNHEFSMKNFRRNPTRAPSRSVSFAVIVAFGIAATLAVHSQAHTADDDPEPANPPPPTPLSPEETVRGMRLPPGFRANVFAGEPDLAQPISFTFDERGRLWAAECYSYPKWKATGNDRVLIFEDVDGDGRFDRRKVFWDEGNYLTSVEVGFGGVWVASAPHVLFIPDRDRDDVPDGPPEVHLDGWSHKGIHNVVNGLTWGPDGWLYGGNGILAPSKVGVPGTPESERPPLNCGVWRYHPIERRYEIVAWGTTNPWGFDFDLYGQLFITNCVIPHVFHVVPGAHFERMFGRDFDPHLYGLMESCADHIHWAGGAWQSSRGGKGKHDAPGGGHAHSGAMVYLGDNWPDEYRGSLFTANLHGNRVNHDRLTRRGSGYVATHERDFLTTGNPWFWGVGMRSAPDGSVYLSDWVDDGECHGHEAHRATGRIYRIAYGETSAAHFDLAKASDDELLALQDQKNVWWGRTARRVLAERAESKSLEAATRPKLEGRLRDESARVEHRLRALWALHTTGGVSEGLLRSILDSKEEWLRAWAVRLSGERNTIPAPSYRRFEELARTDPSPLVRLHLASLLQRVPLDERWKIAIALAGHAEDADDANLPLMIWYAAEPLVAEDPTRAAGAFIDAKIPLVLRHVARRVTHLAVEGNRGALEELTNQLTRPRADEAVRAILTGIGDALDGRRRFPMPSSWPAARRRLATTGDAEIEVRTASLALVFGDRDALDALRSLVRSRSESPARRATALIALARQRDEETLSLALGLLSAEEAGSALREAAIRGVAQYRDERVPETLLGRFSSFSPTERREAIAALTSREDWAERLVAELERGAVEREAISAHSARRVAHLGSKGLTRRLESIWGKLNAIGAKKKERIAELKSELTGEVIERADLARGRALFDEACGNCHRMFDHGGTLGPDLTGSNRHQLDYILENVVDPNAIVGRDYEEYVIVTNDGRVLSGVIAEETSGRITLRTPTETFPIAKEDIAERSTERRSIMPEGLFAALSLDEIRDLIAYLASPKDVEPAAR